MSQKPNSPKALIIIHEASDGLGPLVFGLIKYGYQTIYWNPIFQNQPPLQPGQIELIIELGGTANVGEAEHRVWMARETAYIEQAISHNKPVFAICLGAQMLADIYGARIYSLATPEKGICQINIDYPEGIFKPIHQINGRVFQSHAYGFDLPLSARRLAHSPHVPCQAFAISNNIIATQFHPDATREIFTGWLLHSGNDSAIDTPTLLRQLEQYSKMVETASAEMFTNWLATLQTMN